MPSLSAQKSAYYMVDNSNSVGKKFFSMGREAEGIYANAEDSRWFFSREDRTSRGPHLFAQLDLHHIACILRSSSSRSAGSTRPRTVARLLDDSPRNMSCAKLACDFNDGSPFSAAFSSYAWPRLAPKYKEEV